METRERSRIPNILRTLSDLRLRNKDKQIVVRTSQNEASCSSENNKDKELQIAEIENSLHNWSIPRVNKNVKYINNINFGQQIKMKFILWNIIHLVEYSYPRTKNNKIINLIEQSLLDQHIRDGYNFIHLGLIQVAAKPNYKLGINSPILVILRDIRLKRFNDSKVIYMMVLLSLTVIQNFL